MAKQKWGWQIKTKKNKIVNKDIFAGAKGCKKSKATNVGSVRIDT